MTYVNYSELSPSGSSTKATSNVGTLVISVPLRGETITGSGTGGIETGNESMNVYPKPSLQTPLPSGVRIVNSATGNTSDLHANELKPSSVDEFYPHLENLSILRRALDLLDEGLQHTNSAVSAFKTGNLVIADDEVQCVNVLLPELFCCRIIGEGFGALVNALRISLVNQKGLPLNMEQINGLSKTLRELRSVPFMTYDLAVQLVMQLEDTGLIVDPPALNHLAELEDE